MNKTELIELAASVRKRAYTPYSGFAVGAALEAKSGNVYLGCNVENASFGITSCAERNALFAAIAAGEREFRRIAIVGAKADEALQAPCMPCGACRQALLEFCEEDFEWITYDGVEARSFSMAEMMPHTFILKAEE